MSFVTFQDQNSSPDKRFPPAMERRPLTADRKRVCHRTFSSCRFPWPEPSEFPHMERCNCYGDESSLLRLSDNWEDKNRPLRPTNANSETNIPIRS